MTELPKNFPEHAITYKALLKKIKGLGQAKNSQEDELKIQRHQAELDEIKNMFPEKIF